MCGGGVVSVELKPSRRSDEPEAAGDAESSLSSLILFMARRTEAASSSWTCWCLEMSSLDVYCHSGVCSQLDQKSTLFTKQAVRAAGGRDRCVCAGVRAGHSS